jgi:hypothetical protein
MVSYNELSNEEKQKRELMLDKTLADSFPASDPPSSNPNPYSEAVEDLEQAA